MTKEEENWLYEMYSSRYDIYKNKHKQVAMESMMTKSELLATYNMSRPGSQLSNNKLMDAIVEEQRLVSRGQARSLKAAMPDVKWSDITGNRLDPNKIDEFYEKVSKSYKDLVKRGVDVVSAKKAISNLYFGSI